MKLLRLKINQKNGFRSLQEDFEMLFLDKDDWSQATTFNPYVFAGKNGSGKSNVLEALAEIFYHLDCIYLDTKPSYFDEDREGNSKSFNSKVSRVDAYELEYLTLVKEGFSEEAINKEELNRAHIYISKKIGERPKIELKNTDILGIDKLQRHQIKQILPKYVIGYASGENETLSFPFFKSRFIQYDAYYSNLITESRVDPSPESSLIYIDKSYSQIVLLANLLMQKSTTEKDILAPFKEYVGLEGIDTFRIVIRTDIEKTVGEHHIPLLQNIDYQQQTEVKHTSSYIDKLKNCATTWYEEENYEWENPKFGNGLLYLDYKVNDATKQAFQFHFENNPLKLFELFQLLLILDTHSVDEKSKNKTYSTENIFLGESINFRPIKSKRVFNIKRFRIKKKEIENTIFTKALSDGEHQFLHSLGLCLLFKDTNSLFLLDEPETHFNPSWKAKFLSSLRFCFELEKESSNDTMREMLITTHSPFLISDTDSNYVQVFRKKKRKKKSKKKKKKVTCNKPDFQTLGASINDLTIEIFDKENTIGDYALDIISSYEKRFRSGENGIKIIKEMNKRIGDSTEKTIFINQILNEINLKK